MLTYISKLHPRLQSVTISGCDVNFQFLQEMFPQCNKISIRYVCVTKSVEEYHSPTAEQADLSQSWACSGPTNDHNYWDENFENDDYSGGSADLEAFLRGEVKTEDDEEYDAPVETHKKTKNKPSPKTGSSTHSPHAVAVDDTAPPTFEQHNAHKAEKSHDKPHDKHDKHHKSKQNDIKATIKKKDKHHKAQSPHDTHHTAHSHSDAYYEENEEDYIPVDTDEQDFNAGEGGLIWESESLFDVVRFISVMFAF